ncbi:MAG TPA: hypothetical protein VGT98_17350 [Candidatus Elarobacter sp.]|nr:hypothetical protein [Candidatus Elarobacter sp.]
MTYVAHSTQRVDLLGWTANGSRVTGYVESRWVDRADPFSVQSGWINFHGTLQGNHLVVMADGRTAPWVGTVDAAQVVLHWSAPASAITTTFVAARAGDFDSSVQLLGDEVATASSNAARARAAALAASKAQAQRAADARRAAVRAAALARAEAGRISAARAAAHRRRHP